MAYFITGKAETLQSDIDGRWYTEHNQLFHDDDGLIYLAPRNYLTDGFTIPLWIAPIGGGKMQWDIRPAVEHDFECQFHQAILVNLSLYELRRQGYVRPYRKQIGNKIEEIVICEDIPIKFLSVVDVKFNEVNARFKRMMKATTCIKNWRINLMRFAVNFNVGWLASGKKKIDIERLYRGITNDTN